MPSPENKENGGAGFCAAPFLPGSTSAILADLRPRGGMANESAF